jgi:sulfite reductase alpha subunit-like flavoprotein
MLILYGSQTGTAAEVAEGIGRQARRWRLQSVAVSAMDAWKQPLPDCTVFVCSTTGQGEEPENMKVFII